MTKIEWVIAGIMALAAAPAWARPVQPTLVVYKDAQVQFSYPKGWRNLTVADDASKAEARSDDGSGRLTIESLPKPAEGGVTGVLEQRLPGGSVAGAGGDWRCTEGDVEGGKRHAAACGRRVKNDIFVVAVTATPKFLGKGGDWKALVLKLAAATSGFKAPHEDE